MVISFDNINWEPDLPFGNFFLKNPLRCNRRSSEFIAFINIFTLANFLVVAWEAKGTLRADEKVND